jgi:hypothetical protein
MKVWARITLVVEITSNSSFPDMFRYLQWNPQGCMLNNGKENTSGYFS